jgi:plastocyanin
MKRAGFVVAAIVVMAVGFVAPAAAGGGGCHRPATEATGNLVDIKKACFTPSNLHVQPGQRVTWVNNDTITHVVAGSSWGHFDEMSQGDRVSFRFDDAGVYPYTCYLHPGMNGAVIVGDVKTPSATIQDLGVGAPSLVANPDLPEPPAAPVEEPDSALIGSAGTSPSPWQAVGFIAFGLIIGVIASLATQRLTARRSRVAVTAG